MLTSFKEYLNESNTVSDNEDIQTLVDIISSNPSKYQKYIDLLKNKYNFDFFEHYNDDNFLEHVSLDDIKNVGDFLSYQKYIEYAKKIFKLRNLKKPKHLDKTVSRNKIKELSNFFGLNVKFKKYTGFGNYAEYSPGLLTIPEKVDVNTLIHELGHFFDHYSKGYEGIAKSNTHASSFYGISKSDEVFAENFLHYFIAPKWLNKNLPNVYKELNNKIPNKFKKEIRKLVK